MSVQRVSRVILLVAGFALLGPGCAFLEVKRQQELGDEACRLSGEVKLLEEAEGPRVVLLIRRHSVDSRDGDIVDHYSVSRDGRFYFVTTQPGIYALAAFYDRNRNLAYDLDEPARVSDAASTFELAAGDWSKDIALEIDPKARAEVDGPVDIRSVQARSARDQMATTIGQLTVEGEVADLSDPRFGAENGKLGLWRPFDFIFDVGPGIYFTEAYDPARIPVLFAHGMSGHPQEFTFLAENLDSSRFQPWFYFYPSGAALPGIVEHLTQLTERLRAELGFRRLFVVAHSMGGLVARGFISNHFEVSGERLIPLFVSISTPWAGDPQAQKGVDRLPIVIDSWKDVAPDSEYLSGLFFTDPATRKQRRGLPGHLAFHMLFGYQRNGAMPGASSDKVVALTSQLRPEAQADADGIFGFDADHTGILRLPETSEHLNSILAAAAK